MRCPTNTDDELRSTTRVTSASARNPRIMNAFVAPLIALLCGAWATAALPEQASSKPNDIPFADIVPANARAAIWIDQPTAFFQQLAAGEAGQLTSSEPAVAAYLRRMANLAKLGLTMTTGVPVERLLAEAADGLGLIVLSDSGHRGGPGPDWVLVVDTRRRAQALDELLGRARKKPLWQGGKRPGAALFGPITSMLNDLGLDRAVLRQRRGWVLYGTPTAMDAVLATLAGQREKPTRLPTWRTIRQACSAPDGPHATFYVSRAATPTYRAGVSLDRPPKPEPTSTQDSPGRAVAGPGQLLGIDRVRALGGTCRVVDGRVVTRELVVIDEPSMGALGMARSCKPVSLGGARFVPADYDVFCAMNLGRGKAISDAFWSCVAPLDQGMAHSLMLFRGSARSYGADFYRDFLLRFTGDMFIACRLPDPAEPVEPVFRKVLLALDPIVGIQVRDPDGIMPAWRRFATAGMVAAQGVRWETEPVGPHTMHVLRAHGKPILEMEITFAFVDDTWLITLSAERMRAALQAGSGQGNLAGSPTFRARTKGLVGKAGIIAYANPSRWCDRLTMLIDRTQAVVTTASTQASNARHTDGFQANTFLRRLSAADRRMVRGLARMMRAHSGIAVTVRNQAGGLLVTSYAPLGEPALAHLALFGGW